MAPLMKASCMLFFIGNHIYVEFEALAVGVMKVAILLDVTPCSPEI
jgi:hypothetical protein